MHHLIAEYIKRKITKFEKDELFSQMETDAGLKEEFISVQNLCGLYALSPSAHDEAFALEKLQQFKHRRRQRNIVRAFRQAASYAAIIGLTALATWMVLHYPDFMGSSPAAYEELITPASQRVQLKLHDGTVVWLNARSTLRYPSAFAGGERKVELVGEAFFDVAPNEKMPFIVSTEKLDILALGTKFNVLAYQGQEEFNTSLLEGSVKIYNKENREQAMFLKPNEYAKWEHGKLVKGRFNNLDFLLWKDGIFAFDNMAFTDIMRKMEWYYDIKVNIHNSKLGAYKFSGKIRLRDGMENVLNTLQKIYHFSFVKDDENNIITIR